MIKTFHVFSSLCLEFFRSLNLLDLYRKNRIFLVFCLVLGYIGLYFTHSMIDEPFVLKSQKIPNLAIQTLFYVTLSKVFLVLTFYSLFSALFFWWLFYYRSIKLGLVEYWMDFFLISMYGFFICCFFLLFFFDFALVRLTLTLAASGCQQVDMFQALTKLLLTEAEAQTASNKECTSCQTTPQKTDWISKSLFTKSLYSRLSDFSPFSAVLFIVPDEKVGVSDEDFNPDVFDYSPNLAATGDSPSDFGSKDNSLSVKDRSETIEIGRNYAVVKDGKVNNHLCSSLVGILQAVAVSEDQNREIQRQDGDESFF